MKKICPICGEAKNENKFRRSIGGGRRNVCQRCQDEVGYIQLKVEVFGAYGNKCVCCGETNPIFFQLDHVNNDGKIHRHLTGPQFYKLVKKLGFPIDFQLLCSNCNWAKGHWGTCPHQSGRTTEKVWAEWNAILARKGKRYRCFQEKLANPEFTESRPFKSEEMKGNTFYPKTRKSGRWSKAEVTEGLKQIEAESFKH